MGLITVSRRIPLNNVSPYVQCQRLAHWRFRGRDSSLPKRVQDLLLLLVPVIYCCRCLQELLCELMGWGVAPSLHHYEHLAETYALHKDVAAAEQVLDRMQAAGHTPLLRSYNRLLSGIAMNGNMGAATRVYARLKAQGLQPDEQTMRGLFKCVRVYAGRVRVDTARKQALAKPGDRWVHVLAAAAHCVLFVVKLVQQLCQGGHACRLAHTWQLVGLLLYASEICNAERST
jgi:pentatricopeptide repeat protein